jgi:hypothetical protein
MSSSRNATQQLPWMTIQLLYGLNAFTISLLTLPLQYIINTRVQIPLPFLPTYGAIAFLPWSLKPIYAILTTTITTTSPPTATPSCFFFKITTRSTLCLTLLTLNSICTACYVLIPTGGIAWVFITAIIWGITNSWAEFCLGLSLIDHAQHVTATTTTAATAATTTTTNNTDAADQVPHQQHQQQDEYRIAQLLRGRHQYQPVSQSQRHEGEQQRKRQQQQQHQDTTVAKLQSQAASARNIGSFVASILSFGLFLERYVFHRYAEQLSGDVVDAIFIGTALLLLVGVAIASIYRHDFIPTQPLPSTTSSTDPDHSTHTTSPFTLLQQPVSADESNLAGHHYSNGDTADTLSTDQERNRSRSISNYDETTTLTDDDDDNDDDGSHPSYSSFDDEPHPIDDEDSVDNNNNNNNANSRFSSRANLSLIILLQFIIIVIATKDPLSEATSHFVWKVLVISLVLGLGMTVLALCLYQGWSTSHGVGLFLILRNAVPNEMILVSSFYYTVFQSQPLLLQILSVVGTGVLTVASWSYNKFLSPYSSGKKFLFVLGGTAVVSAAGALLNISVYNTYATSNPLQRVFAYAVAAKFFGNFLYELGFLPQVILATTSLSLVPAECTATHNEESTIIERPSHQMPPSSTSSLPTPADPTTTVAHETDQTTIAVEYGSFISCIDFGDQLGSMAGAPLVALLGITRDNDYLHLDRLILICVILKMVVSVGLLPLIQSRK